MMPLALDQITRGEDHRTVRRHAEASAGFRVGTRIKQIGIDAIGNGARPGGVYPERDGELPQAFGNGNDARCPPEGPGHPAAPPGSAGMHGLVTAQRDRVGALQRRRNQAGGDPHRVAEVRIDDVELVTVPQISNKREQAGRQEPRI